MVHWYITKSYTRKDKWVSCAAGNRKYIFIFAAINYLRN